MKCCSLLIGLLPLLPFTEANAFYDASVESSRLIKNLKTDFGATGQGVENDSARLQAAIDEVSRGGGGIVRIPAGEYFLTNVSMKSNVHLEIDPHAVLKPYLKNATKSVSLFNLGIDTGTIENVSIRGVGGRYTVRLPKFEPGIRVFSFKSVRNFLVSDVNIEDSLTKFACFQFGMEASSKTGVWRPTAGTIANANVTGAAYGYGLVQIQAAESVRFENLSGTGGTTLRMETGEKRMNDAQIGGMDNIVGRNISCTDGNAAVMISPHSMKNGVVTVDGVKSVGCGFGVRIANGFISTKYATPNLQPGSFAAGSSVRNLDATFGLKAQLKSKHFKYVPAPLKQLIQDQKESEDGESVRGPAIAAVLNEATYHVTVENVTPHGFKDTPAIMTESNAAGTARRQKASP